MTQVIVRRYRVLLLLLAFAILVAPGIAEPQKTSKKGKPCGNTCIAKEKTCRAGEGEARGSAVSPALHLAPSEAPADARFVASSQGRVYYWIRCDAWKDLKKANLIFFATRVEAERVGYKPSKSEECRGPD